jgi:NTF2-like N-terminal transpeptidase domain
MQGQGDQGMGPFERPPTNDRPYLNGTGQHRAIMRNPNEGTSKHQAIQQVITQKTTEQRAIPKRPPGMARIDTPPEMVRAPRPSREQTPPQKMRKRILIFGGIALVLAIIACTIGSLLANGINTSAGPSTAAVDFISSLNTKNYAQAYKDLGPAITIRISQEQFTQQAKVLDTCYGKVSDYTEVANSAKNQDGTQTYTYTITRELSAKKLPYKLQLTLQKDPDDGTWKVSDYSNNLGPAQPVPACTK